MYDSDLKWSDFKQAATWLAYEISGNYYSNKKDFDKQPFNAPFQFIYRKPIQLFHEQTTIYAIFIEACFWTFYVTGKPANFNPMLLLQAISLKTNLYHKPTPVPSKDLKILCYLFAKHFPLFISQLEKHLLNKKRELEYKNEEEEEECGLST